MEFFYFQVEEFFVYGGDEMAENVVKPWYPKNHLKAYSYVDKLQEENVELYSEVKNLLWEAKHTMNKAKAPSLKRLESLWKNEREKETELIRFLMKDEPNFNLPEQVGDYIRVINHLFSLDAVFERNISRIQAITKGSKEGKIDVSSFFDTYLEGALKEYLKIWLESGKETINIKDLKEVFYQAMLKMFSATDNDKQAYLSLASSLEQLSSEERDELLEDIFYLYFGKSLSSVAEDFRNMGDIDFNPSAVYVTRGKGFQGNVLETVELLALQEVEKALSTKGIKATAKGTGKSGVKADNILTIGFKLTKQQQELFDGIGKTNSSVRVQNIERMQALHDSIKRSKQSGYIVEISDKNYTLTSSEFASKKGFTAQRGVKLSNLRETLKNIKFQQGKVEDIIFVLANSGSEIIFCLMIQT